MAIDPVLLRQLYVEQRLTIQEVAMQFGCGATTVRRRFGAAGIAARRRGPDRERQAPLHRRTSPIVTWSSELAWVVGLIATDGNLSRQGGLSITSKDRSPLETVKACLGLTTPIGVCVNGRGQLYSKLQWYDRSLYEWLTEIGLTPAKSLTLKPLAVPDEYFRDFLRGCIDGDGTVLVYTDRQHVVKDPRYVYERLYVSLVSASRPFIDWITARVRTHLEVKGAIQTRQAPGRHPLYRMRFAKRDSIRILRWIYYSPDLPCLERKRLKAKQGILAAGGVLELADNSDSKSDARKGVGVQVPSPPPTSSIPHP